MSKKLSKDELQKKKTFHKNRFKYYKNKIKHLNEKEKLIGFKHY